MDQTTKPTITDDIQEKLTTVGSYVLVRAAKKIEMKTDSNLVIPDAGGGVKKAPRGGTKEMPRAAEFTIVQVNPEQGRDETERPLVKDLKVGMRIVLGQATLIPIFLNGESLFLVDALSIVAIVVRPTEEVQDPPLETP